MDGDNQFEVQFTTTADTSGAEQEKAALDAVTDSAEAANTAASKAGAGNSGADFAAQLEREKSLRDAILSTEEQTTAEEEKQIAAEERRQSLLSQRTAIAEQQLEALQAEAAGDNAAAAALEREVEIRKIALQLQQATTLSEEEAMVFAEQRVAAEELITAQIAAQAELNATLVSEEAVGNYGRLATAAQSFAERAALGVTSTRSLVGLLNAFPPQIALAAAAAFGIYEALNHAAEAQKQLSIETEKTSQKLQEEARAAIDASYGDTKAIGSALEKQADDLQRTRNAIALAYASGNQKQAASLKEVLDQEQVYFDFLSRRLEKQKEIEAQDAEDAANHQRAVDAQKAYQDSLEAADDLQAKLHSIDLGELDPAGRLDALGDDLDKVGEKLRGLGLDAKSPEEALAQLSSYPTVTQAKMVPLIEKWAELQKAEISAGEAAQKAAEEADKPRQKAIADLDAEIARLEKIRTLQLPGANTPAAPVKPADALQNQIDDAQAKYDAGDLNYGAVLQQLAAQKQAILQGQRDALNTPPPAPPPKTGPRGAGSDADIQQRTEENEEKLNDEAQKLNDSSKSEGDKAASSLQSAAQNFDKLPPHFDAFRDTIQEGTQTIASKSADVSNAFQSLSDTTVQGFQTIQQVISGMQKQISDLSSQIASLS